jgi:surface antigen
VGSFALLAAASTCIAVGAATPSFADGDDYPWAGLGQCPLKPLPPPPPAPDPAATAGKPDKPDKPGKPAEAGKPGQPSTPAHGAPASTPAQPEAATQPAADVPRECARYVWYINGSYADPWGFALRNCTSFVAWRLRETNGVSGFSNHMDGGHWGNAADWDENARALGYLVDDVPAIGAVAQTDEGRVGHVAWVSAVDGDTVTIEEYNHAGPGIYSTRTVPVSDFRYIHVADVAPAPSRGSSRVSAAAADEAGRSWSFQVERSGNLVRRETGARARVLGARGAWSTLAAPTTTVDDDGLVWLAAVTRDGRIRTSHSTLRGGWSRLQTVERTSSAPTSSPALVSDGRRGVRLLTVTPGGDLVQVRRTQDGWGRPLHMGAPGSWGTHTAVTTAVDSKGRTWLAAVTADGRLMLRSTTPDGKVWHKFVTVAGASWSQTSSPALDAAQDGLWLHAVTGRGELHLFRIRPGETTISTHRVFSGTWSPYSSPAVAVDEQNRTWLAAVAMDGRVLVRHRTRQGWTPLRELGRADKLTSPALNPRSNGRVLLSATSSGRTVVRPVDGTKRKVGARPPPLRAIPAT